MVLGGLVLMVAWIQVITACIRRRGEGISIALYLLTVSVGLQFTVIPTLHVVVNRHLGIPAETALWSAFLIGSFAALFISVILMWRNKRTEGRFALVGSSLLLLMFVVGFTLILLGLPGMQVR
jgi:hypothetical protein